MICLLVGFKMKWLTNIIIGYALDAGDNIKHLKHRIDAIDLEKLTYSYAVIEGDAALEKVDSISHEIKFEATEEGGCKTKNVSKYHPKEGVDVKGEDFKAAREEGLALLKVVDAYLVANPEAYAEGNINSGESVIIYSSHADKEKLIPL